METHFNILVATDYSQAARNAERYAVQLAKQTQSPIRFVHVFASELQGTSMSFDADKIDYNPVKYEYDKLCDHTSKLLQEMNIQTGELNYKCVIREGSNVRKHIMDEADNEGMDLIIAGTHGSTAIRERLFGSHTWDLIQHAEVPVLAVPEHAVFKGLDRIVFATEYREGEIPAVQFLTTIAKKSNAEVTVLHITNYALSRKFETKLYESFRNDIRSSLSYDKLKIQLVHYDRVIDGLNEYCDQHAVNWLVMSPQRLTLLDKILNPVDTSVTKHMSFHTHTPLLVLPDFYNTVYADLMKMF